MTSNVNWSLLSGELAGFVALPGDSAYTASLQIDNGRIQLHPAAVVFPFVETDVARAIKFARDNKIPMTAKGGGHSAAGYCLNRGGMVIDLQYMNAIEFDRADETVRVQLGARWREVYIFMEATGTGLLPRRRRLPDGRRAGLHAGRRLQLRLALLRHEHRQSAFHQAGDAGRPVAPHRHPQHRAGRQGSVLGLLRRRRRQFRHRGRDGDAGAPASTAPRCSAASCAIRSARRRRSWPTTTTGRQRCPTRWPATAMSARCRPARTIPSSSRPSA